MGKKQLVKRSRPVSARGTNWVLIGGVAIGGVLILVALLILATRQTEVETLASYCDNNPGACYVLGSPDAPVTMVEVADFGCTFCRNFHVETLPALVSQYVESGRMRFIVLPYALSDNTLPAANASMCAGEQGQYFPFADGMYYNFDDPTIRTRDGFFRVAATLDLDIEQFTQCVNETRYNAMVRANMRAAANNGVSSTPTFFINNSRINGAFPLATFQQRIDALP